MPLWVTNSKRYMLGLFSDGDRPKQSCLNFNVNVKILERGLKNTWVECPGNNLDMKTIFLSMSYLYL